MDSKIKLLRHYDRVEGILDDNFLPPIMADVDVACGACNLDCVWCCQKESRQSKTPSYMPIETMKRMGSFCREWGIKSWRIAGDSEPLMNPNLHVLLNSGAENGIDMGMITNGVLLRTAKDLHLLRWLGISLDATTAVTWSMLKKSSLDNFGAIIENIKALRQVVPELEITIKFLKWFKADGLSNYIDMEALPDMAKALGVNYQVREPFTKSKSVEVCRCTPLYALFGADHEFRLCCDNREGLLLTDDYTRNDWRELPDLWGSEKHKELIASINPKSCNFCSKQWLNDIFESIILDGKHTREYQVNFI